MNIGQGSRIQLGMETVWGTGVDATHNITHKSESLKYVANKKTEESLVGKRAPRGMQTMDSKVEGDVSFSIKPDEIGFLLALALGDETATALETDASAATRHTFEPISEASESAPKATLHIDRKEEIFRYISCKVDSFKLSGSGGGFLEGSMTLRGYDEDESGEIQAGVAASELKGYRFADAAVTVGGVAVNALVKSFDVEVSNGLESENPTLGSGTKHGELEWQAMTVKASMELLYDSVSQSFHGTQYKADTNVAVVITLTSPELAETDYPYELKITIPVAQISESIMNLADGGRIKHSMSFEGQEDESNSVISIEVVDAQTGAYI